MVSNPYSIGVSAAAAACLALALGACEDTTDADDGGSGAATSGDAPDLDCTPNSGDGRTACSVEECPAGEYCRDDFACAPGCASTLNCAAGEFCDLRMPQTNNDGTLVGVCRSSNDPVCSGTDPTAGDDSDSTTSSVGEACSDVEGNYRLSLDDGAPSECELFVADGDMCSVAQSECTLTWGCGGELAIILTPGPLDGNDVYEVSGTQMGLSYECTFEFTPGFDGFFSYSCSVGAQGQAIVCQGFGSKQ